MNLRALDRWHKTRIGLLVFALVELAAAYGFASLAIDDGNLLVYLLMIIFAIGGLQNIVKLVWSFVNGNRSKAS